MSVPLTEQPRAANPGDPAPLALDSNEGLEVDDDLARIVRALDPALLRSYPSTETISRELARVLDLDRDRLLVTAGGDEALDRCCRAFLRAGDRVVVPTPGFLTLEQLVRGAGAELIQPVWEDSFPVADVIAAIRRGARMVVLTSPNNPTGTTVPEAEIAAVLEAARDQTIVVLDLVYREYARDRIPFDRGQSHVVAVGTLSKAWGLAGCRIGYAASSPQTIELLREAGPPYSVAAPSAALAAARLATGASAMKNHVARVRSERDRLTDLLDELEIPTPRSQANFVFPDFGKRAPLVDAALADAGIRVRAFRDRESMAGRRRITLPADREAFARLTRALVSGVRPEALLFDLDGVLADVGASYDRAIVATAASFGVEVDDQAIRRQRAAGDCTNDWRVTQRLLALGGANVELEEVRARFQELYLGTSQSPGFRDSERLLVERQRLRRWARRRPLAVVTGRPRDEAHWFLDRFGVGDLFGAVVTMDDGPGKPDPWPVRRALRLLGVDGGWMLGDTVDDVRAASAAGVLAIGVGTSGTVLTEAGARLLLADANQLEEILP